MSHEILHRLCGKEKALVYPKGKTYVYVRNERGLLTLMKTKWKSLKISIASYVRHDIFVLEILDFLDF